MGYIKTPKNKFGPCVFCDKAKIGDDHENLVVFRGENAYVLMNLYPYNNGHLMITPYEHEEHFEALPCRHPIYICLFTHAKDTHPFLY